MWSVRIQWKRNKYILIWRWVVSNEKEERSGQSGLSQWKTEWCGEAALKVGKAMSQMFARLFYEYNYHFPSSIYEYIIASSLYSYPNLPYNRYRIIPNALRSTLFVTRWRSHFRPRFFWWDGEREEEIALKQLYRALVRSSKISVLVLWAGNEWIRALGGGAGGVHGVEWQREMELHSRPSNSCPQLATTLPFQFQHFFTSCAKARSVRRRNECCTYWDMG